jgi:hypothetical protein
VTECFGLTARSACWSCLSPLTQPKDAKEAMDERGFFARLKADTGDEAATGDDGDRRKV